MTLRTFLEYSPVLGERVFVDASAVVIGRVRLGTDVSVWPLTAIRGDVNDITVGDRTNIQDGSVLHNTSPSSSPPGGFPLVIGSDVTVGHKVILHGCSIGDRVLVGMGSIIMDGAVVESDVIVGGGSVVTPGKVLASGGLYVGAPAKRVRDLRPEELEFLRYSAAHYVKLKDLHISSSTTLKTYGGRRLIRGNSIMEATLPSSPLALSEDVSHTRKSAAASLRARTYKPTAVQGTQYLDKGWHGRNQTPHFTPSHEPPRQSLSGFQGTCHILPTPRPSAGCDCPQ